jgi:hypothetical protein
MERLTNLIKQAKAENAPHKLFKAIFEESASMDQFLDYVERSKKIGNYRSDQPGFYIMNSTEISHISDFPNIQNFYDAVVEAYKDYNLPNYGMTTIVSEIYRNFSNISGVKRHTDPIDTIHWQCVGATIWHAWDKDGNMTEYLVEPGDVMFINYEHEHEVDSITPRAGILFTAGAGYYDSERRSK